MLPSRESLLLWPLQDIRDRLLRFIGAIDEIYRSADTGERSFLQSVLRESVEILRNYQDQLGLQLARRVESLNAPSIVQIAKNEFSNFTNEQKELVPKMPIWRRPSGDIAVFAANCLSLAPSRKSHRQLYYLTYGRYTTWITHLLRSSDSAEGVATVPIPFAETLTALRWPLLAHELAHSIYPGAVQELAPARLDALKKAGVSEDPAAGRIFSELFADLVGFRRLGMAYAYALATEAAVSLVTGSAVEPTIVRRLQILGGETAELGRLLAPEWELDVAQKVSWPEGFFERLAKAAYELDERAARQVSDRMQADGLPADYPSEERAIVDAALLLTDFEPAPSVFLRPEDTVSELNEALRIDVDALAKVPDSPEAKRAKDLVRRYRLSATHRPCNDADILTAAWRNELMKDPQAILESLRTTPFTEKADPGRPQAEVEKAIGVLAKKDTALSRSLQVAHVHRWLRRYDTKIQDALVIPEIVVKTNTAEPPWGDEDSPLSDVQLARRLGARGDNKAKRLVVRPLISPDQIGTVTLDLRLGTELEVLRTSRFESLNPGDDRQAVEDRLEASSDEFRLTLGEHQDIVLHPGELLLALTLEYLRLPRDLWGNLEGRSTWARLGLQVHATAGMVDPGFEGYLTLELQNTGRLPLVLFPGLRVGQMAFFPVSKVKSPYNRKETASYSAQTSARSRFTTEPEHEAMRRFRALEELAERTRDEKPPS